MERLKWSADDEGRHNSSRARPGTQSAPGRATGRRAVTTGTGSQPLVTSSPGSLPDGALCCAALGAERRPVRCQKPAALRTRESSTDELVPSTSNCRRGTIRCEQINCPGSSRREFYWAVAKLIVETGRLLQAAITQQKHNVINRKATRIHTSFPTNR